MNQPGYQPYFSVNLPGRQALSKVWRSLFLVTTAIAVVFLVILVGTLINQSVGYVAIETKTPIASLVSNGHSLEELDKAELVTLLQQNLTTGRYNTLNASEPMETRAKSDLVNLVYTEVLEPEVQETWLLTESIFHGNRIKAEAAELHPDALLQFKSWLNFNLLKTTQSSDPLASGIRTALLGSIWSILITILVAFPLGVGAALYLEEYARDTWVNRMIQTNINNLAGVPSIIYGMLGLAIFVRTLSVITSGAAFGLGSGGSENGRTLLSAGLTLALLVLPLIIINTQEAVKAVPDTLRQASYGLGATQWQTIWYHVLPNAMPGILTGTILAISRAIGETAPLVVVGAATYITFDPNNVFSRFTTLPIQIYQWSSRPQAVFQHIAAAAILVLLILLLSLNSFAIVLRIRYRK